MKDTVVMLFHTKTAAEKFRNDLEDRGFAAHDFTMIGPDDLPQYGRGEHAVAEAPSARSGLMDKLAGFFGMGDADIENYADLCDYLEAKGLSHREAEYYQNEVRDGSTMLIVRGGERIEELESLTGGPLDRGVDTGTGYYQPPATYTGPVISRHDAPGSRSDQETFLGRERDLDVGESERMTLYEEEPVIEPEPVNIVEPRPVVNEDVEISKRPVSDIEREDLTLKREELEIDREGDIDIADEDIDEQRRQRPAA